MNSKVGMIRLRSQTKLNKPLHTCVWHSAKYYIFIASKSHFFIFSYFCFLFCSSRKPCLFFSMAFLPSKTQNKIHESKEKWWLIRWHSYVFQSEWKWRWKQRKTKGKSSHYNRLNQITISFTEIVHHFMCEWVFAWCFCKKHSDFYRFVLKDRNSCAFQL